MPPVWQDGFMTQLVRHICALAPVAVDPAAEWIEILPVGDFRLADHRGAKPMRLDPASAPAVIAASFQNALGGELLIDFDHRSLAVQKQADSRAAGWVKEMRVEGERVMASVIWTPEGRAALEGRSYRFLSPVFKTRPDGSVGLIEGAALVNDPALPQLRQLASKETLMDPISQIAGLLGIAADKPEDIVARVTALAASETQLASITTAAKVTGDDAVTQICARLAAPAADPAQFVPKASFDTLQTQFASLQKTVNDGLVEAALERARDAGKLTPDLEGWATQLASKDLAEFEAWEAVAPVRIDLAGRRQLAGRQAPKPSGDTLDPLERQVASRMGVTEADFAKNRNTMQEG